MSDTGFLVLFVLFGLLVIAGMAYSLWQQEQRRRELGQLASAAGMSFSAEDTLSIPTRYAQFDWLDRGSRRSASNVMRGERDGLRIIAFDYSFCTTSGAGRSRQESQHALSCVILDARAAFPPLLIRPESMADRIASAVGFDDIDFESAEFSTKYYVSSPDRKFAYGVLHPRMMEFLLARPGWSVAFGLNSMMFYRGDFAWRPDQFQEAIQFALEFAGQIPEYLWQDLKRENA